MSKALYAIGVLVSYIIIGVIGGIVVHITQQKNMSQQSVEVPQVKSGYKESEDKISLTTDQLYKLKFSYDIMRLWGVDDIIQDPENGKIFYYLMHDSSGWNFIQFDATRIGSYLTDENLENVISNNTRLLTTQLSEDKSYNLLEKREGKLIFGQFPSEMGGNFSCVDFMIDTEKFSINVNDTNPIIEPFEISDQEKKQRQQAEQKCLDNLNEK